jgi:hypothetical protein
VTRSLRYDDRVWLLCNFDICHDDSAFFIKFVRFLHGFSQNGAIRLTCLISDHHFIKSRFTQLPFTVPTLLMYRSLPLQASTFGGILKLYDPLRGDWIDFPSLVKAVVVDSLDGGPITRDFTCVTDILEVSVGLHWCYALHLSGLLFCCQPPSVGLFEHDVKCTLF